MLTRCPECEGQMSDTAPFCPHCGYVNNKASTTSLIFKKSVKSANKRPKLPHGFGSIKYRKDHKARPYSVYPPSNRRDYDDNGKLRPLKCLGTFQTYGEAYQCLVLYNQTGKSDYNAPTFSEIYTRWFNKECGDLPSYDSKVQGYRASYKYCTPLYDLPITSIYSDEIQNVIDACPKGYSTKSKIKQLISKLFQYSISNGICQVNYSTFASAGKNDNKNGVPLSEDELKSLWRHSDNKDVQICLIYLYTGYRLSELKVCEIDLDNMVLKGGLKTAKGRERIVPIHSAIQQFVRDFDQINYNPPAWRETNFRKVKKLCGIEKAPNGENRTAHDFRHTFSWLADHYGMDKMSKAMILGHSRGNNVEDDVYGHRTVEELRAEIEKLPQNWY